MKKPDSDKLLVGGIVPGGPFKRSLFEENIYKWRAERQIKIFEIIKELEKNNKQKS
jgi:hypothetical protein